MPWTGNGTFQRTDGTRSGATLFEQQEAAGVNIEAPLMDAHANDIVQGLENTLTLDGQNSPTAAIPFGGQRITNLGSGTAINDAARLSQIGGRHFWGGTSGGSANSQTISLSPSNTSLQPGDLVRFIAGFTNTGSMTLTINGVAYTVRFPNDATFAGFPGAVTAGTIYECIVSEATRLRVFSSPMYMSQAAYDRQWPVNGPMQIRHDDVNPNTQLPAGVSATWDEIAIAGDARMLALRASSSVGDLEGSSTTPLPNHVHDDGTLATNAGDNSVVNITTDGAISVSRAAHTHDVTGETGGPTTNPNIAIDPRRYIVRAWRRSA